MNKIIVSLAIVMIICCLSGCETTSGYEQVYFYRTNQPRILYYDYYGYAPPTRVYITPPPPRQQTTIVHHHIPFNHRVRGSDHYNVSPPNRFKPSRIRDSQPRENERTHRERKN